MVKRLVGLTVLVVTIFTFGLAQPALAADITLGAKVFNSNCAACHAGGINVVMGPKTLKKDALEKFGMNSPEAIINQVRNGKAAMPSFKSRLTDEQIEAVAAYVLAQADKGWSK